MNTARGFGLSLYLLLAVLHKSILLPGLTSDKPASLSIEELRRLPKVGYHPDSVAYYGSPYFANALAGGEWVDESWNPIPIFANPQFDERGYPRFLKDQRLIRALIWPLHASYDSRLSSWPKRAGLAEGRWLVTWKGEGDVRLSAGRFLPEESNGGASGSLIDGRRFYDCEADPDAIWSLTVHAINPARPLTDLKVWLPDPANRTRPLEGQTFHPSFLRRLGELNWGHIRFMNWGAINGSPEREWDDRRRPDHCLQNGVLNPRSPAEGVVWFRDENGPVFVPGDRPTGVAWEHMVALCNARGYDLWLNVPHLTVESTTQYLNKLARLVAFGSDGVNPYERPVANPKHAPLNPGLRVFLEYSNEIWAGNGSFPQGLWARARATESGTTEARFNARQFSRVWTEFENILGAERVIRVAAAFTGGDFYTRPFLDEFHSNTNLLRPELLAVTTYFGNNIQHWAKANITGMEGKEAGSAYWKQSPELELNLNRTFDRWIRFLLTESGFEEGSGRDAVDVSGGFATYIQELSSRYNLPLVAYEGGPSIYTNPVGLDFEAGPDDDEITHFMASLNRHPRMREVYRIHLEFARWRGLWSHMMFTDSGGWSKYGQWGHLESLDQPLSESPKYAFLLNWANEHARIRHPHDAAGTRPSFPADALLPFAVSGMPYSAAIPMTGDNGPLQLEVIASQLPAGLHYNSATRKIEGTAETKTEETGSIFLRVTDTDGDADWQVFKLTAFAPDHGIELDPVDDASILSWEASTAHGAEADHWIKDFPPGGASCLFKFDLRNLSGQKIRGASFRFQATRIFQDERDPLPARVRAQLVADDWQEETLTAKNAPEPGKIISPELVIPQTGRMELNVTQGLEQAVSADDSLLSLALVNHPSVLHTLQVASKENGVLANRPKLHVTIEPVPSPIHLTVHATADGQLEFHATGKAFEVLHIESSLDLREWSEIRRITTAADGRGIVTFPLLNNASAQYFRAHSQTR